MTEFSPIGKSDKENINPYVSGLASRLMKTAAEAEMPLDSSGWELITEVLSFAAAAEQRMNEQQHRISYLEELSITDELTGLSNRRGLQQALGQALAMSTRHKEPGVLGFMDLDGFKQINDTYGHAAGDAVLRHVATLLKNNVRPSDVVARIAGDEFAIVLTRCSSSEGSARMIALQTLICDTPLRLSGDEITVGVSVGVEAFREGTDAAALIENADMAMYRDKAGRRAPRL